MAFNAILANTILFIAMAKIMVLNLPCKYSVEILGVLQTTKIIFAALIVLFAWLTIKTSRMVNVITRWRGASTYTGINSGLSVAMLSMIPASFEHFEMLQAVIIGVIALSTFICSGALIIFISRNSQTILLVKMKWAIKKNILPPNFQRGRYAYVRLSSP